MPFTIPNDTKTDVLDAWQSGKTLRVLLDEASGGATLDIDADTNLSDVSFDELDDASYSRVTVSGVNTSTDDTDDEGVLDATDVTFSSVSGGESVEAAWLYVQVSGDDTTPGDDTIVAKIVTSEMPITTNGSDIVLQWSGEGILNLG